MFGFSGASITPATAADNYPALTQTHPDVSEWYIVRVYGDGDSGYQALNQIHTKQDTRTLADHANDVAPVLEAHFPGLSKRETEWAKGFWVGGDR